jgi:thymidine phosphorylase
VELHAKPGDVVRAGQPLLTLHTDEPARLPAAVAALDRAVDVGSEADVTVRPLVLGRVGD